MSMNSIKLTHEQSKDAQRANFGLFGGESPLGPNMTRIGIHRKGMDAEGALAYVDDLVNQAKKSQATTQATMGGATGAGLGSMVGAGAGSYKGATFDPDVYDEEGNKRVLSPAERALAVAGGYTLGSTGGAIVGGLLGAGAGGAVGYNSISGSPRVVLNGKVIREASMSRYPGTPVASFKHGVYKSATFNMDPNLNPQPPQSSMGDNILKGLGTVALGTLAGDVAMKLTGKANIPLNIPKLSLPRPSNVTGAVNQVDDIARQARKVAREENISQAVIANNMRNVAAKQTTPLKPPKRVAPAKPIPAAQVYDRYKQIESPWSRNIRTYVNFNTRS